MQTTLRRTLADDAEQLARVEKMVAVEQQWRRQVAEPQIAAARSEVREASTSYAEGSAALQQSASHLDAVATAWRELASRYRVEA